MIASSSWRPRLAALALLAATASFVWTVRGARSVVSGLAARSPGELGLWKGEPLPVSGRTFEILGTKDVSLMEYRLGGEPPLWFAKVAGFGDRAAFHPPELCYVGSHFEILERGPVTVFAHAQQRRLMRLLIGGQGGKRFEAWYWFTAGSRTTPSYYQQQAWLLLDSIRRRPTSGTLMRISTEIDSAEKARRRLLAFVVSWETAQRLGASHGSS